MKITFTKSFVVIILLSSAISGCKKPDDTLVHIIKDEYNFEDQREIGKSLKKLILKSPDRFPILHPEEHAMFYDYINTLIDMIANTDHVTNRLVFDWDATIIHNDEVVNAFITPGGQLFVYTGLLKFIDSESELFSILAHEINYADSGDLMERLVSDFGKAVIGDLLLDYDLPETRNVAYSLADLDFKESEVLVADRFALTIICPFHYNALGLKSFLEAANTSNLEIQWLINRPSSITRIESIEEYAENCGRGEHTFAERYAEYKALLP